MGNQFIYNLGCGDDITGFFFAYVQTHQIVCIKHVQGVVLYGQGLRENISVNNIDLTKS